MKSSKQSADGRAPLAKNISWGTKWGLSAALFFGAWITIVRFASGTQPFDEVGMSYGTTIAAYFAFGLLGGVLLGFLRPLASTRLGSAITGWLLAIVVYTGFGTLLDIPPWRWDTFMLIIVLIGSLLVGAPTGVVYWRRHHDSK